jgi:predicted dienelactone hydrolase
VHYLKNLIIISISIFSIFSFADEKVNVGLKAKKMIDKHRFAWDGIRKRPILTHIFYPTLDKQVEALKLGGGDIGLFNAGHVVWNAKPVISKPKPLIIMSHGTGGSSLQMLWIASKLVKNGYIVAGVNHHGNTAVESKKYAEGFKLWWERTQDLKVVLSKLENDKYWRRHIAFDQVGVVGFSLGGYTALSALGGITDKALFSKFCKSKERDFTCEPQIEFAEINKEYERVKNSSLVKKSVSKQHDSFKISQIKAGFLIAPAVVRSIREESIKTINVPVKVVVGTVDKIAPSKNNAKRVASLVVDSTYMEINNAGHYTFLSKCTKYGKNVLPILCNDHGEINRSQVHEDVSNSAVKFFDQAFAYNKSSQSDSDPPPF